MVEKQAYKNMNVAKNSVYNSIGVDKDTTSTWNGQAELISVKDDFYRKLLINGLANLNVNIDSVSGILLVYPAKIFSTKIDAKNLEREEYNVHGRATIQAIPDRVGIAPKGRVD